MFTPVACSQCGKPFQVQQDALGKPTVCPWCQATVAALPVGTPAPAPSPAKTPEPLSLDDAPPAAPAPPPRSKATRVLLALAGLLALAAAAGATIAVKQRKHGHLTASEWKAFTPPDKAFTIEMLGTPAPDPEAPSGETRYVAEGWYSGVRTWVGWRDLTQVQVQQAGAKDAFVPFSEAFFTPARDRLHARHGGSVVKNATTNLETPPLTHEVRVDAGGGVRAVERMFVYATGPRPRVYFVGLAGHLDFESPAVQRLFDSFRVSE